MHAVRQTVLGPVCLAVLIVPSLWLTSFNVSAQDHEPDHEALRKIRAVAEEAINTNNLELFKPLLADSFSIVTYTDREFSDFDAFKKQWQKTRDELLDGGTYTTDMQPELSQIIGDIAIARGNSHNVLINGSGEHFEFPSRWTAVLHKSDGQWKVVRAHSSLSPFDNPMLRSGVKSILVKVGAATLAVGIALGWLLNGCVRRFRRSPRSAETTPSSNA
ncbi:MAG: nuclear transport factor 2 family protein [Planctomycetaceae bacterium]|nr:nuclear transport factor 2 family protein [Planctomycetales bacterium]MCB9926318.1 nuclear transport factor 2 family protein [Planctomycetaceae bacterium]